LVTGQTTHWHAWLAQQFGPAVFAIGWLVDGTHQGTDPTIQNPLLWLLLLLLLPTCMK